MSWDFSTDPEYQEKLDWADAFVREEVEPLDLVWPDLVFTPPSETVRKVIDPLKQAVRDKGLWATHLEPALGGQGHGAVKLCLLNERQASEACGQPLPSIWLACPKAASGSRPGFAVMP